MLARVIYSASAEDPDTTDYYLVFNQMSDSPRRIQKHVIDMCVFVHAPQSKSEKACKPQAEFEENNTPCPRVDLR